MNLLDVSESTKDKIRCRVRKYSEECSLEMVVKCEGDDFLYVVLVYNRISDKYIVWLYNNQDNGLFEGNYDLDIKQALKVLRDKI